MENSGALWSHGQLAWAGGCPRGGTLLWDQKAPERGGATTSCSPRSIYSAAASLALGRALHDLSPFS